MKVSIIVPTYNSEDFVHVALDSALNQTHKDLELIVVDDGSSDKTVEVVQRYCNRDKRVTLIRNEHCRGPSAARNAAINVASGDWIALLDSDDEFLPHRLQRLLDVADFRQLDMVIDAMELVDFESRNSLGPAFDPDWLNEIRPITLSYLLERDWPGKYRCWAFGTSKPIFRRGILIESSIRYAEDLRLGEDLLFYSEILISGARVGVTKDMTYRYSVRKNSISSNPRPTDQLIEVNRRISRCLRQQEDTVFEAQNAIELLKAREAALWFHFFTWSLKNGFIKNAVEASRHMSLAFVATNLADRTLRRLRSI